MEGKTYDVDVEVVPESQPVPEAPAYSSPRPVKMPPPAFTRGRRIPKSDEKTCRSPVAGVVTSVAVMSGQTVTKNDLLLIVEAMKMETRISSLAAGIIKSIRVAPGDAVKPGQVLIEFE
jgi:biotin carboxyl carrier protein